MDDVPKGQAILTDGRAESVDPSLPAFLARPKDAPVYHGFRVLEGVELEGFKLGMISGYGPDDGQYGDGFVIAPDNSRCGLVWEVGESFHFREITPPEPNRWGVWDVSVMLPMTTEQNARENLRQMFPELKQRWMSWRSKNERADGLLHRLFGFFRGL
jgi:hypothetical protein